MPALTELAGSGLIFDANRATAATANGAFASMLTGLPARGHTLETLDGRLPSSLTTVADAVRQAGIETAMFTANPTTGAAFGFDHGWDTFVAHPPAGSTPAVQVFDDAATWVNEHRDKRFFVVVHARGGHPPWDVSAEELRAIALTDEAAELDPRRAAEFLARARRGRGLPEAIRTRAWALYNYAVDAHDAALGRLVGAVRSAGQERETTFIVTGDVSVSEGASIPFVDGEALEESVLTTPLVVRPSGPPVAARRVGAPTSSLDLARTVVDAFGLAAPAPFKGADVLQIANDPTPVPRPQLATVGPRSSLRWGTFVLFSEREARLCDLSLDPTCLTDVRETHPIALGTLQRTVFDALAQSPGPHPTREPVVLDVHTSEALRAWGRTPERPKGARAAEN
jgi:arylsulfatase A-like enzyme